MISQMVVDARAYPADICRPAVITTLASNAVVLHKDQRSLQRESDLATRKALVLQRRRRVKTLAVSAGATLFSVAAAGFTWGWVAQTVH